MPWFRNFIQLSAAYTKQSPASLRKPAAVPSLVQSLRHFSVGSENKSPGLEPTKGGEKPRVVVLGSGWAGCKLIKDIDTNHYDIVCISPRNHMVFTPLLASTCVGTLEFRSVAEPIGRIQPALSREPGSYFFLANCTKVDFQNHQVFLFPLWFECLMSLELVVNALSAILLDDAVVLSLEVEMLLESVFTSTFWLMCLC